MKTTPIEWTDFSANPLKYRDNRTNKVVWACVKKSTGCANCYSESLAQRFDKGSEFTAANMRQLKPFIDEAELKHILTAKTIDMVPVAGKRCFLGDMTDLFGDWVPFELLDKLFAVLAMRQDVTFQILTKRPDRMAEYFAENGFAPHKGGPLRDRIDIEQRDRNASFEQYLPLSNSCNWPLPNVWLGTSVENQATADERIQHLLNVPAKVRFLSCEPLLGEIDFTLRGLPGWDEDVKLDVLTGKEWASPRDDDEPDSSASRIHWVIVGGESGADARPCNIDWIRSIVRQCQAAHVPVFVKQLGSRPVKSRDIVLNEGERIGDVVPLKLKDTKGGDPAEWPTDLRVREFSQVEAIA